VNKARGFKDRFNALTGKNQRHNKALHDLQEWLASVQKFLATYNLYGSSDYNKLLESVGDAKFDLTAIAYNARPIVDIARNFQNKEIPPLIVDLNTKIENLRRGMMKFSLSYKKIDQVVPELIASYEKLQETISNTEYL